MQRVKLTIKQYYFLRDLIKQSIITNVFYKDNRIVIIELSEDDRDKIRDLAALSHLMWALFSSMLILSNNLYSNSCFCKEGIYKKDPVISFVFSNFLSFIFFVGTALR